GLPSQRGITLSFIAHDAVSGQQAPLGTIQGLVIDRQAPSSTAAILGAQHYTTPGGITYVAAGTPISLSAIDPPLDDGSAGSGVRSKSYQVDGGTAQTFAAPFSLSSVGDGPHTITYWAGDAAGNTEAPHTLSLVLDATPPVVTPLVTGAFNPDGSANGPVTVAFMATDASSGLRGISYAIEPGFAQPYMPGQQIPIATTSMLDYAAVDEVGNSFSGTLPITVATPSPTPQPTDTADPTAVETPTPTDTADATVVDTPTRIPTATHTPTA